MKKFYLFRESFDFDTFVEAVNSMKDEHSIFVHIAKVEMTVKGIFFKYEDKAIDSIEKVNVNDNIMIQIKDGKIN